MEVRDLHVKHCIALIWHYSCGGGIICLIEFFSNKFPVNLKISVVFTSFVMELKMLFNYI